MEDRDPIKQIQHLLDDPGKVLERIARIQTALGSTNTPSSEAPPPTSLVRETAPVSKTEDGFYRSLLLTLREVQSHIEQRLRPLALQTVETETERLHEWMQREQRALDECVTRIDQNLLACVARIKESQNRYTDLNTLKQRLEALGASPGTLTEFPTSQDPSQIITARLETLRRDGKI